MNQSYFTPKVSLLLGTCDAYDDTWTAFFFQLKKHWKSFNMPVYLATESKTFHFEPFNIFHPLKATNGTKIWSNRILKTLDYIQSEFILFMLDDFWLTSDVDNKLFDSIIEIMGHDKRIGYINLYADKTDNGRWLNPTGPTRGIKDSEYDLFWETTKECPFRITTSAGLWRKSFLQKLLRSNENAWQFEGKANWRANAYHKKTLILETKKRFLFYPNGGFIWGGKCKKQYINLYPAEITTECVLKRGFYDDTIKYSIPINPKNFKAYINYLRSYLPFNLRF